MNFYQTAECSISLRKTDFEVELTNYITKEELANLVSEYENTLKEKYITSKSADESWQITLNNKVTELLTEDESTKEENYYGNKIGRYVSSLIDEYAQLPFYKRENIVFMRLIKEIQEAITNEYLLSIKTTQGVSLTIKPYKILTDSLSMYHYLVGYVITPAKYIENSDTIKETSKIISIRISRISTINTLSYKSEHLSEIEKTEIDKAIKTKGVQFLSSEQSTIKVWLSDEGIKKYKTQIHLRPNGIVDQENPHIYTFDCTETQIRFYFLNFGKDARILSPPSLAELFKQSYLDAYNAYNEKIF